MDAYNAVRELCTWFDVLAGLAPGRMVTVGYKGKSPQGFCALAIHAGDRVVVVEADMDYGLAIKDPGRGVYEFAAAWGNSRALSAAARALENLVMSVLPPEARSEAREALAGIRRALEASGTRLRPRVPV